MERRMRCLTLGQRLTLGAAALVAASAVFTVGATLGAALNGQVGALSVARIPLRELLPH